MKIKAAACSLKINAENSYRGLFELFLLHFITFLSDKQEQQSAESSMYHF